MRQKKAYVLIFTVTILSLVMILTHQLMRLVQVGTRFDRAMVDRERAEMIALGGINLAIAQLTISKPQIDEGKRKIKPTKEEAAKKKKKEFTNFLERILPNLNRWQVFNLKEEIDGVDGELKICISCENGKININEIFDFKKEDFQPTYKKILERVKFNGNKKNTFLKNLTDFFKKRKQKLDDISELKISGSNRPTEGISQDIKLFYDPPKRTAKPKLAKPNTDLALQDLFTIWTGNNKLEALFLSDALCAALDLQRPAAHDKKLRKEIFKKIIKNFDPNTNQNTIEYWKRLKPLYKQKSATKIESAKIFSPKFEPQIYSVLSSGKVGNVEQKVLAIIEKTSSEKTENKKQKKVTPSMKDPSKKKTSPSTEGQTKQPATGESAKKTFEPQAQSFRVVRIYWV